MRTPLTVAAVAATGLLLVGGGTALALGKGGAPDEFAVVPTGAAIARTADLLPPELPRTAATAPAAPAPAPAPAAPAVDRAAAERAALAAAGGGRVTEVEFDRADSDDDGHDDDRDDDRSHGRDHWEVEVVNGTTEHDLDIDAATGQVLDHDVDQHDGDDDDRHDRDDD
ncbi:PepSY domain-containing protein [Pseudonocardia sp. ICBG1293]|uniref:PepSY domain-containing protein n=1 Tax=Pseudonocardia sp. ICBG1293 TaxID=2844382 RepID=UPI001CCF68D6|nr:PepSY domain-containing protein [Pseudonocardia sp. ICBG1293]